jgi:hypothetical protein
LRKLTCRWMLQSKHAVREKKITIKALFVPTEKFYILYIGFNLVKLTETSQSTVSREIGLFFITSLSIKH